MQFAGERKERPPRPCGRSLLHGLRLAREEEGGWCCSDNPAFSDIHSQTMRSCFAPRFFICFTIFTTAEKPLIRPHFSSIQHSTDKRKPNFIISKSSSLRNLLIRSVFPDVFIISVHFAYAISSSDESCNVGDSCFFSFPETISLVIVGTVYPHR
ncbi:methyltransferase [Sesbania bispinosa]|nr:methyltransferase [Sesbania bispinosa]